MSVTSLQEAIDAVGGDQFLLIRMATKRAREILRGSRPMIDLTVYKHVAPTSIAIEEIQQGLYTEAHYDGELKTEEQLELEKKNQEQVNEY